MILEYNKRLKLVSRELRGNMTRAEHVLWSKVRGKQINAAQFYRQKIIGSFVVDFYCPSASLVLEVDGSQHYEKSGIESDNVRDDYLNAAGLKILRFTNIEVCKNIKGVLEKIKCEIEAKPNPSRPSFAKGRRN